MSATDAAPPPPTVAPATPEHRWLARLVGEWTVSMVSETDPDAPPAPFGTERVRAIGELWTVAEGEHRMPDGGPATTIMTLGFDPKRGRFVGTWLGSMMTHLWVYDGELDADGRVLTLAAEGPSMAGDGAMRSYRDVIELRDDDHRLLTSHVLGADGAWSQIMSAHYRRAR